ncbi:MAG: AAA family ATPase [Candidatus Magasanikbacteria bacterium]
MHITNFQIENFRNIVKADINFGKINIFTGKNSSGKSNFLLALSNALKTDTDFSDIYYDNIVTFGKGKSRAIFKTTVSDINTKYIYQDNGSASLIGPEQFRFENTFSKRSLSPVFHQLFFTGTFVKGQTTKDKEDISKKLHSLMESPDLEKISDKLIYEKSFNQEQLKDENGNEYIKPIVKNIESSDKFLSIFSDFAELSHSWVDPKIFSSTKIFEYVVERIDNNEIYEQVITFLKSTEPKRRTAHSSFHKAKFIHLLADIQKNQIQRQEFEKDLKFYTDGLVANLYINLDGSYGNKGEIIVGSANSPKDIFYISAGTAVLIYFITIKNWINLPVEHRSYKKPEMMAFDEIDSIIHPSIMAKFTEILRSISKSTQLFISSHSPHFIDCFEKNELFWLKDTISISEKTKSELISNIFSYEDIIKRIPDNNEYFVKCSNSELFIDGLMDSLFPLI